MTWFASAAVKLVGVASVAALLSLGAAGVLAKSTPSETATSVATKASAADKSQRKAINKAVFEAEAAALNMSPKDLKAELKKGTKVSDLAKVDKATFTKKLLDQLTGPKGSLTALVSAGTITQAQADKTVDRIKKGHIPYWDGKHHHRPKK